MQAYLNPTRRNMIRRKNWGVPPPHQNWVKPPENNSFSSRQPRKLKFGMQAYFNPTRRNWGHKTPPPPQKIGLILKLAILCNQGSIQLSQAKADPSIAWARFFLSFAVIWFGILREVCTMANILVFPILMPACSCCICMDFCFVYTV